MDWDNLRFFLELARAKKLTVAARRLGVDHTTVARRVQALEKSLGQPLFIRGSSGYGPTEAGRRLLVQVEAMESAYRAIEQDDPDTADQLSGLVRIGATEGYGIELLAGQLAALTRRYPHLGVDLLAVPRMVRLSRHEADIVITLERPERGPYIITRLTDYVLRLYASADYLAAQPPIRSRDDLRQHGFVSYIEDLLYSKELHYLDDIGRPRQVALRSTSILAQQKAAAAGAGIAILPSFAARKDPALVEVLADQVEFTRTFWMLMPVESKDLARMRVTWDFLREMARQHQDLMMGR
ncbi:transcriptional regulator, LysR family [Azotobacter vinelandii CA]|uniref:Transcriptional regulator, LysR family n=2 Tax=Azotobacter vinelandii TaxID=354 RepID=C1DNT2_AZOVD|nr:LysR family transcriptional regulator [Azotobacter vinelandii]ACO77298.1 transcriptional regulator, LysR family [Azotobacter vinelandii DJ]AGK15418.1 transcriptional regulator, LysR family [Azotobacter vinelandii CA]AGK19703.1 transcriptional regulator, LysR family [Azotobacter vinelandii CA6]WKN22975.1 LysR family transcriptional regulator [Azotobacter vinelandii]SFX62377.1 transcriptional regulator, LysR family [Azotobacter vinelandii]